MEAKLSVVLRFLRVPAEQRTQTKPAVMQNIAEQITPPLSCTQYAGDGSRELLPCVTLCFELLSSGTGELIEFGATVVVRCSPLGLDPAATLKTMQCGIEGALLHPQHVARNLLDALKDASRGALTPACENQEVMCLAEFVDASHALLALLRKVPCSCRSAGSGKLRGTRFRGTL